MPLWLFNTDVYLKFKGMNMRTLLFLIATYMVMIMASISTMAQDKNLQSTVLAGGCFWCIESDFEKLDGVTDAVSGYAGGTTDNPTYQNHSADGHLEVIKVTYDADKLSYKDILEYHVRHIDPTDGDGQFCDRGPQYRPAIFVENAEQRAIAQQVKLDTAKILDAEINIDILDAAPFYMAEDYHQDYKTKSPIRYKFYRWNCGRDQQVDELWGSNNTDKNSLTINQ
jgi:peptide-methionine (S)-S-oxide reductase